jgi:HKD family nuclease
MSALLNVLAPIIAPGQTTHKLPMDKLLNSSLEDFLKGTMRSAPGIFDADAEDRFRLLDAFDDLSETQDKVEVFRYIFKAAQETCMVDRDRDILRWTQTLLECLLGYAITTEEAEHEIGQDDQSELPEGQATRGLNFAAAAKKYTPQPCKPAGRRRRAKHDDDEYVPSDDSDSEPSRITVSKPSKCSAAKSGSTSNTGRSRRRKEIVISDVSYELARSAFRRPDPQQQGYFCKGFFFPGDEGYEVLLATLQQAKKTIDLCIFTLTDDTLVNELLAARDRGVRIRIICDDVQAKCLGADPFRLRDEHGFPVISDHNIAHMHNKFAVLDDRVLITGSYNWTKAAHYSNNENIIILNHPGAVREYKQEFQRIWEKFHEEERQGMRPTEEAKRW